MMAEVAADLVELARAIETLDPSVSDGGRREAELTEQLYRKHYCRPTPAAGLLGMPPARDFLAALSEANRGSGTMESGWTLVAKGAESCVVRKHGVQFWVAPERVSETGGRLRVAVPKEMTALIPGFYYFVGNTADDAPPNDDSIARFYWHVIEAGATAFVATLSATLNEATIPFAAKVLRQPGAFARADAAVLYLNRRIVTRAIPHLRAVYQRLRPFLRNETPMFTLRLAPGFSAADDPGNHRSFGQHRCSVAARGLVAASRENAIGQDEVLAFVVRAFESEGICPSNPHLLKPGAEQYPEFLWQE